MLVIVVSKDLKSMQEGDNSWDFFRELDALKTFMIPSHHCAFAYHHAESKNNITSMSRLKLKPLLNPPTKRMNN